MEIESIQCQKMTLLNLRNLDKMRIPEKFTINGQTINVEVVGELDSEYGNYSDAKELIRIAKTIKEDKEVVKLSQLQIENTFWHEVN